MNSQRVKRIGGWRALVVALLVSMSCVTILPVNAFAAPTNGAQPASVIVHIVRRNDTLLTIAHAYGVSVQAIMAYNHLSNPNRIYVGQKIFIPLTRVGKATFQEHINHQRSL